MYNYLFAKKHGGDFILRIEDTDEKRFVPGAEEYIRESLAWLGISPTEGEGYGGDKGPYKQSDRKHIYGEYAHRLVESGHAYYAFDTAEDLAKVRSEFSGKGEFKYDHITRSTLKNSLVLASSVVEEKIASGDPYVIRAKIERNESVRFHDSVRGWVVVNTNDLVEDDNYWEVSDVLAGGTDINDALTDKGKEAWSQYFIESFNESIQDMLWTIKHSMDKNDGLIDVWRSIQFNKGDYDDVYDAIIKGHHGGVGVYWSWEENAADAHWGSGGTEITLHGQVRPEDIEWEETLRKNVYDLKDEKELEIGQNAAIKLVGMAVETADRNKNIYKEFDTPYVVKVGSTYVAQ